MKAGKGCRDLLGALAVVVLAWTGPAAAAPAPEKIVLGYSTLDASVAPGWIAQESGAFKRHGLDVQLVFVAGGTQAAQALIARDLTVGLMASPAVINARLAGSDLVFVAGLHNFMPYVLIGGKGVTAGEQLRGKRVGLQRFGDLSEYGTRIALEKLGLNPDRDATLVQVGAVPARLAAASIGAVQAATVIPPYTLQARRLGLPVLVDLIALKIPYLTIGAAIPRETVQRRPEMLRSFMRALVEGIHFYKTQKERSLRIIAANLKTADLESIEESYEIFAQRVVERVPYPTIEGLKLGLAQLARRDPRAQAMRVEDLVELSFLREIEASGYVRRLYGEQP